VFFINLIYRRFSICYVANILGDNSNSIFRKSSDFGRSTSGYDDKYYEAYFAVDPEVIDKTIPDDTNGIPGYNLIYIFGILSILVAILIRKKIKK
jgi:hypothetical protein